VGRVIAEPPEATTIYHTVLLLSAAAVIAALAVRASRLGLALRGIGADEERAQTLGVNARRAKIAAFALSAFFAGALGAAMAVRWTYIDPPTVFNPFIGFQTVLIAMVGGAHTVIGPIASSVLFSLLTEFLRLQFPYLFLILLGLLLILLVLYLPGGLASLISRWRLAERVAAGLMRWRKSDA
jgi:branched-chain amino acid transport system permease protein